MAHEEKYPQSAKVSISNLAAIQKKMPKAKNRTTNS
jgi:hypothetical protein